MLIEPVNERDEFCCFQNLSYPYGLMSRVASNDYKTPEIDEEVEYTFLNLPVDFLSDKKSKIVPKIYLDSMASFIRLQSDVTVGIVDNIDMVYTELAEMFYGTQNRRTLSDNMKYLYQRYPEIYTKQKKELHIKICEGMPLFKIKAETLQFLYLAFPEFTCRVFFALLMRASQDLADLQGKKYDKCIFLKKDLLQDVGYSGHAKNREQLNEALVTLQEVGLIEYNESVRISNGSPCVLLTKVNIEFIPTSKSLDNFKLKNYTKMDGYK